MNHKPQILIATSGTSGDIFPFITIAQILLKQGHNVLMLIPKFHEKLIESFGINFKVFGSVEEFQSILKDPDLWHERKGFEVVWKGLSSHLGIVRDIIEKYPKDTKCYVICHPILVPSAELARISHPNILIVSCYLAPSNLCSSYDFLSLGSLRIPGWLPLFLKKAIWTMVKKTSIDPALLPILNKFRKANKLPPVSSFFAHIHNSPDFSISLFPSWFSSKQSDWPAPFFEGNFPSSITATKQLLPPSLVQFLSTGEAPILFTPGTGNLHTSKYFSDAMLVLKLIGRRGLFITPFADQVPKDLPPEILWLPQAPFHLLFNDVAAVVHHGGIGTMYEAFLAGKPQLVIPYAFDQFDNGFRAKRLGVAEVITAKKVTVKNMSAKLKKLLSSKAVAYSCSEISILINQKSPDNDLTEILNEIIKP